MSILKLTHNYAVGTLDVIKKGLDVPKTFNLANIVNSFLEQNNHKSLIISPVVIGVYRKASIFEEIPSEGFDNIDYDKGLIIEPLNEFFDVHPSLVQVGYDPKILEKDIIRSFIGPESARMVMRPYTELGQISEQFKRFENLCEKRFNALNKEPVEEEIKLLLELSMKMIYTDGLTNNEWATLQQYVSSYAKLN
jgi:hypothetical protein